jgi:glycyl-tRNA synthetase beta chain
LQHPDAAVLTALNKRIANILKKAPPGGNVSVNPAALAEEAELALHRALSDLRGSVQESIVARRYAESLRSLIGLRETVSEFFERVMVMDENAERRENRLALLREVRTLLGGVADLSRLPG